PGGPAAALGAPVAPEAGQLHVWRGVMDGVESPPARPGSLPLPSSGNGAVMWVVKSNGAVVPAPSATAPAAVTPTSAVTMAPAAERAAATTSTMLPGKHIKSAPMAMEVGHDPAAPPG